MKPRKIPFLFLSLAISCFALVSACGTTGSTPTPTPGGRTPALTSTAVYTPIPVVTSTAGSPTQTSCPAAGTARPAIMSPMAAGSHPGIIYLSEHGGIQTSPTQAVLLRYDVATGSKTTLLSFADQGKGITSIQLSTDGQWLLFIATAFSAGQYSAKLQLMRIDGQWLQTLYCDPSGSIGSLQWSPDSRQVAFRGPPLNRLAGTIHILNLETAQDNQVLDGTYMPYAWLDETHLYVTQAQGSDIFISPLNLYLLDTGKGEHQSPDSLTLITSAPFLCGSFQKSSDGTQLFGSTCTPERPAGCRGPATQGPSTLSSMPATGGPARTIYSSQSLAIMTFYSVSSQNLLLYIENTQGDLSQNGLWKINSDGSGLTRLTNAAGQECEDLGYTATWPQIISNGQSYALRVTDLTSGNESLQVGSVNGGTPTTFETMDTSEGILSLVGMAMA